MNRLKPLITDANQNLRSIRPMIERAIHHTETITIPNLSIDREICVLITNRAPSMVIKEDGIGGFTYSADFIFLALNEHTVKEEYIFEMLSHELCHARRFMQYPEYPERLIDSVISEGLATFYESQITSDAPSRQFFVKAVEARPIADNLKIFKHMLPYFNETRYDDSAFFFRGNSHLPRWSGYSLGYNIIKDFINYNNLQFMDALMTDYSHMAQFAKEKWCEYNSAP